MPAVLLAARANSGPMQVHTWEWFALFAIIIAMILWDLLGHVRKPHEPTIKEAAIWSAFYVGIALLFGVIMYFRHSPEFATEYFVGYLTEKSLSLDNIFVFIIIIAAFLVPRIYQQKVLMWGIIIALILRFVFIIGAAAIIQRVAWVFFVFAAWMLYTAISQIRDGVEEDIKRRDPAIGDEKEEYEPNFITVLVSKVFRVTDGYVGQRMMLRRGGKTWITPLTLCVVSIGTIDLMFALDSIPAIYGLTQEPFIVFAANAFSLLGLRQLFFLVDGLLDRLIYLHFGLAFILGFISVKLGLHALHGYDIATQISEPTPLTSAAVILSALIITVFASIWGAKKYPTRSPASEAAAIGPHERSPLSLGDDDERAATSEAAEKVRAADATDKARAAGSDNQPKTSAPGDEPAQPVEPARHSEPAEPGEQAADPSGEPEA